MTVEYNYATGIATLSDWLKGLAPVFEPMRSKTNRTFAHCLAHVIFQRFEL